MSKETREIYKQMNEMLSRPIIFKLTEKEKQELRELQFENEITLEEARELIRKHLE